MLGRPLPLSTRQGTRQRSPAGRHSARRPPQASPGAASKDRDHLPELCLRINENRGNDRRERPHAAVSPGKEGKTYSQLVEEARFSEAARLLRNTDSKIIDVAYDVGYAHPTHFARAFRRIAGVSPSEYRTQRSGRHCASASVAWGSGSLPAERVADRTGNMLFVPPRPPVDGGKWRGQCICACRGATAAVLNCRITSDLFALLAQDAEFEPINPSSARLRTSCRPRCSQAPTTPSTTAP